MVKKPDQLEVTVGDEDLILLMPDWDSPFHLDFRNELLKTCRERNMRARVVRGLDAGALLDAIHESPAHTRVALLSFPQTTARVLGHRLIGRGFGLIHVDTFVPGCDAAYVAVDNHIGIQLGMRHLLALGHRRILLIVNEPLAEINVRERVRAFKQIIEQEKLKASWIEITPPQVWQDAVAQRRLEEIMRGPAAPTAIFHVSDAGAIKTLTYLAAMGIAVPGDVSVLGFNNEPPSAHTRPALSTIAQPYAAMAETIVDFARQTPIPTEKLRLAPTRMFRESTGPVRQDT